MATPKEETHGASGAVSIDPSDAAVIEPHPRGLYFGAGGNVRVEFIDGTIVTMVDASAGIEHAWQVKRVFATGTTATDIVALY